MKRNNPLKEELSEKINNGETPAISIESILDSMITATSESDFTNLKSESRVIILDSIEEKTTLSNGFVRTFIKPKAGRIDIPIHMVNLRDRRKPYDFGKDWASIYSNNVFLYQRGEDFYCICHRHGGSGCKTLLLSSLNKILKKDGIKVEMNWMPPMSDKECSNYDIDGITMIYEEPKSSDIADLPKQKKVILKELKLNLKQGNIFVKNAIKRYQLREITKEEVLNEISKEEGLTNYNNAALLVKIGKVHKRVSWDEFEKLIDGFDITDKVANTGIEFESKLKECSDKFLFKLLEEHD